MPKVFISHSWKDEKIVREIEGYLKRDGAEVWIDYSRISGGDSLPRRISDALKWCDTLLLFWSKTAEQSEWVALEWENALVLRKRIIPCVLDGTELPSILSRCIFVDFSDEKRGYSEVVRALNLTIRSEEKIKPPEIGPEKAPEKAEPKPEPVLREKTAPKILEKPATGLKPKRTQTWRKSVQIGVVIVTLFIIGYLIQSRNFPKSVISEPEQTRSVAADTTEGVMDTLELNPEEINNFRSTPDSLSVEEVEAMLKRHQFSDTDWNKGAPGFQNDFKVQEIKGDKVVYDQKCGLMWQQGGSPNSMKYDAAKAYIQKLNRDKYAGFDDWRLPTLEEAMSLMEPTKKNGDLYIDPVFDKKQRWIWTADQVTGQSRAWVVDFFYGLCNLILFSSYDYVRAVRFGQSSGVN